MAEPGNLILIADDHPLFRDAMRRNIGQQITGGFYEAENFSQLNSIILDQHPDILILDLVFPGLSIPADILTLRKKLPQTAIIVVSMNDDENTIRGVMEVGVNGFISKAVNAQTMQQSIADILNGDIVCCTQNNKEAKAQIEISQRQLDILGHLRCGMTNKEIARTLDLSPFTVRSHISKLLNLFEVETRTALISAAITKGLI